jgi:superfamily II DNA or RNA helicase
MTTTADFLAGLETMTSPASPDHTPVGRPHPTLAPWAAVPCPGGLPLYPFQQEALDHLLTSPVGRRTFLSLEMGMGKTPTAIHAIAASLVAVPDAGPVLVVVPPSLRRTWLREFDVFRPGTSVSLIEGRKVYEVDYDVDVVLIGDSVMAAWADELEGKVSGLVVDECQRTKSQSQRSNAVLKVARSLPQDGMRLLLTGTLTTNGRPTELTQPLSILDRLGEAAPHQDGSFGFGHINDKGTDKNVWRFLSKFAPKVAGDRFGRRAAADLDVLHANLVDNVGMYRRLRKDVPELEGLSKTRNIWYADTAGTKEARLYTKAEDDLRSFLVNDCGRSYAQADKSMRAEALVLLSHLRRLAGMAKVPATVARAKELIQEGERVFIATWFRAEAEAIAEEFGDRAVKITGGMSDNAKAEAQRRFTTDDEDSVSVLVGNIIAAGTGLTLHGGGPDQPAKCRTIIVGSLPWTPSDLAQVEDRLCRLHGAPEVFSTIAIAALPDGRPSIDQSVFGLLTAKSQATTMLHDGLVCDGLVDEASITQALMEYYGG